MTLAQALAELERRADPAILAGMSRYAIPSHNALGVPMAAIQDLGRQIGRDHGLAHALWDSGGYEARTLAAFVADPKILTPQEMDRWRADFDSWALCDSLCFKLFDRSPHAWAKVEEWRNLNDEFGRRAAFALIASLALHDKRKDDAPFLEALTFIEAAATDGRNFVKKAVNWALRAIGWRNAALHTAALAMAQRLAGSADPTSRWIGKDAVRQLNSPATLKRMAKRGG